MYKTFEQVVDEYDGYWVFMINCIGSKNHSIVGGEVAIAEKDRKAFFEKLKEAIDHDSVSIFFHVMKDVKRVGTIL